MSGARITVELHSPELRSALRQWQRLGRQPAEILRPIGDRLRENTQDRFATEADALGRPWAALGPAYAPIKKGPGILRGGTARMASLQGSMTYDVAGNEVAIGSNKVYAAIHQFGGTIRPKGGGFLRFRTATGFAVVRSVTIPARPFLGISTADEEDVFDIVQRALLGGRR